MKHIHIIYIAISTALILSLPLIAMQFTDEVQWDETDFIVMGTLLFGTGLVLSAAVQHVRGTGRKVAVVAVILLAFLLIWAELAVGIFDTPFAGS